MEDLDPPREMAGAADNILTTLEAHGLEWDGAVLYQSSRHEAYQAALEQLINIDACYPCRCSRREIQQYQHAHQLPTHLYPGLCRLRSLDDLNISEKLRVRVGNQQIQFQDPIQGHQRVRLSESCGDFVIRRADGLFAYQLAVVVDDAHQQITEVVRGADLLDSTPNQLLLQQLLVLPTPNYIHLPIVVNREGEKLSKQTLAEPLDPQKAPRSLQRALQLLGIPADSSISEAPCHEQLQRAVELWDLTQVPRQHSLVLSGETPSKEW